MARPTKEQELRNKLKRLHMASVEKRLALFEELHEDMDDIIREMKLIAKDKNAASGYYKALKDLYDMYCDMAKELDQSIDHLEGEKGEQGGKEPSQQHEEDTLVAIDFGS